MTIKSMFQRRVHMSDGTTVYARIINPQASGVPIVLNDGLGCNGYAWRYIIQNFNNNHPILHWHYRGHGKSSVPTNLHSMSIETLADDLEKVLDCFQIEQGIFCGHSMGVQVLLEAYKKIPERYKAMALICGSYQYPLDSWHGDFEYRRKPTIMNNIMKKMFPIASKAIIENNSFWQPLWSFALPSKIMYQAAINLELNPNRIKSRDFLPYFKHLSSMDARVFMHLAGAFAKHSAKDVLKEISVPTIIVAGGKDTFSPSWLSNDMHKAIKSSELLYIPDGTHCAPIEHPDLINLRLEKFIRTRITNPKIVPFTKGKYFTPSTSSSLDKKVKERFLKRAVL